MITDTDVAGFVALAGPDFSWDVRGCSRPPSTVRRALRDDLWARQGHTCPVCGEGENGIALEFNHVVARGPMVKGFLPGNVFTGHATCNARTKPLYNDEGTLISGVEVLDSNYLVRMDVIPTEWTPFPILKATLKASK